MSDDTSRPVADPSYTVDEFCDAERMSRGKLYEMWAQGIGPRFYNIGNRRRITEGMRQEWHRKLESENGGAR